MSKEVVIGKSGGDKFRMNVDSLIRGRLLVQANSGGGKTHLMRRILETTFGAVQHIVLDIEGEFSPLRKKFDYVLIGEDGDGISSDPAHAAILARKVLEMNVSVIVNLYELQHHQRIRFVRNFLDAMINAPKSLWHPCLIVLDEAHIFAPEKSPSESTNAVIDMCSRGRKRGYCLIPATQRPAKLHKDVAAECGNKLIGVANMDIDRDRAAKELGFSDRQSIMALRDLKPGEFYAVGPAFPPGVRKVKIDELQVKDSADSGKKAPPATPSMKAILASLTDLPREAAQEAETVASLRARVQSLEKELSSEKKKVGQPQIVERPVVNFTGIGDFISSVETLISSQLSASSNEIKQGVKTALEAWCEEIKKASEKTVSVQAPSIPVVVKPTVAYEPPKGSAEFGRCELAILQFLAMKPGVLFTKIQIGAMTFYRHKSGGFNNSLSILSKGSYILRRKEGICLNPDALPNVIRILGDDYLSSSRQSLEYWAEKLPLCPKKIYQFLYDNRDGEYTKEQIAEATDYQVSGGFNNGLSQLATLGLIERTNGMIRFNRSLL